MELKNLFLTSAVAALALTSCTSLDDNSTWDGATGAVKFTSYIEGNKTAKASGTAWADGDKVGVFMKTAGGELAAATAANRQYVADSRGNLTAASADQAVSYPESGSVDFVAYYPYSADVTGTTIPVNVASQTSPADIDLLYSDNAKSVSASSSAVNLGFSHQLSGLVLNVTADATVPTTAGLTVSLAGTKTQGTFDLASGTLTATDGSVADIALNVNAAGTQASAIVLPGDATGATLKFTLNGKTVEKALTVSTLAAGTRYAIPVSLSVSGGQIYVQFGTATITDWTTVAGGSIDVDFGDGGGTVNPDPQPQPGEEVTIFEETFGDDVEKKDGGNYWPGVNETSYWTSSSGLTFTDAIQESNGWSYSNISIRKTSALNPHAWFASNKQGEMTISGFNTTGYTGLKLTYSITANADGDQSVIGVKWGDNAVTVPAKAIATKNSYQEVELTGLEAGATSVTFTMDPTTNTAGYRIDNIKLVGTK